MINKTKRCLNCNKELSHIQEIKKCVFCSKGCATSYRQKSHDPDFFSTLDISDIFYLCGLIASDGNISKDYSRITLGLTDDELIHKIYPFFSDIKKRKVYISQKGKYKKFYTIISSNKDSILKLRKLGITPNKSNTLVFVDELSSSKYVWSFIRGYFDGDGCAYLCSQFKKIKYYAVSFTSGSLIFLEKLQLVLKNFGIHSTLSIDRRTKDKKDACYYLKIYKQDDVKLFYNYIYSDKSQFFLKRKKEIFDNNIV